MSATIPAATTAQIAWRTGLGLLAAMGTLVLISGLGLLKRRRFGRGYGRADPPSLPRVVIGGVLLCVALTINVVRNPPVAAEPDVIGPARFSSQTSPTLSIAAAPGWTFSHDAQAGKLTATGPHGTLMIETSLVTGGVDMAALVTNVTQLLSNAGGTVEGPSDDVIDSMKAVKQSVTYPGGSSIVWHVPRGGPLLTVIVCRSSDATPAAEVCRDTLATLRWRAPGPL